ncbi:MAG: S-layer homology domain-containing protein [Oscillospiraceae bacterium]|nr:S-layer homology domain-containing protein [Oscillospiraceae bacterium]
MKVLKKTLALLLALVMCVGMLSLNVFAAETECEHNWVFDYCAKDSYGVRCDIVHKDAYKCTNCGETKKEFTGAGGHGHKIEYKENIVDKYHHTANCTECIYVETTRSHDFVGATCQKPGTCKCGAVDPKGKVDPNNHVNTEIRDAKDATCAEAGYTGDTYCKDCDVMTDAGTEIPATGKHNFGGDVVQMSTATGGPGHAYKCANLGCDAVGKAVPCTFGAWSITQKASCEEPGAKTRACTACGFEQTEEIPANGHTDEDHDGKCDDCDEQICDHDYVQKSFEAATCEKGSITVETCSKCQKTRTVVGKVLGHDFQDTVDTVNTATCTQTGEKTQYCSRCDATQTVETKALGHDYEPMALVPATCVEAGTKAHLKCSVCDSMAIGTVTVTEQDLVIPSLGGHAWDDGEVTTPATETADGVRTFTCTRENCGATYTAPIPATGTGGTEIEDPDVPMGGDPDDGGTDDGAVLIDEPEVPLAGLMTRAEFVNYLYVQAGSPDAQVSTFADVAEDHEYAAAIGWAQANGIAKGITEDEFAPDEIVSVDQAHLFLVRYAQFMGVDMPELAALAGKDPLEILDNADEVLAEFFAAISPKEQAA